MISLSNAVAVEDELCKVVLLVLIGLDLDRETESTSLLVDKLRHIPWHVATNARVDAANKHCCGPLAFYTVIYSINVVCQVDAEVALVRQSNNVLWYTIRGLIARRTDKSKNVTWYVDFACTLCAFINSDTMTSEETNTDSILGNLTDTPHAFLPRDNFPGRIKCNLASRKLYRDDMARTKQIFC